MAFSNHTHDPARRATAIAGVVAIHAALGAALLLGLKVAGYGPIEDDFTVIDITPDPVPTPEPLPSSSTEPTVSTPLVLPQPPIELPRQIDVPVIPIDDAELTTPTIIPGPDPTPTYLATPTPTPSPSFAAKRAVPRNDPSSWISTDDYPSAPLRNGVEGLSGYRVVIGSDGQVSACEITSPSGNAQLDRETCRLITRRARFVAATDTNGTAVVGTYSGTVRWEIPN
jgi:protein TonB